MKSKGQVQIMNEKINPTINQDVDPSVWFVENEDKWSNEGDHIEFYISESEIPQSVKNVAKAYVEGQDRYEERVKILRSMGILGNEDWD